MTINAHHASSAIEMEAAFQANLLAQVNEAIVAVDTGFIVTYLNPAAERLFGYTAGEAIGKPYKDVALTKLTDVKRRELHNQILASDRLQFEVECMGHNGGTRIVDITITVIRDEDGIAQTIVGIHRDVTQQRRTEERLRILSAAVEQCPVSIMITDLNGRIEYVNPRVTELTGYASDELIGKNPRILKSGTTSSEEYGRLWQTIQTGMWRGVFQNRRKNGNLFWEAATILPIRDQAGTATHYLAVKEDITARREMETALRESEQLFRVAAECSNDLIYDWDLISNHVKLYGSGGPLAEVSGQAGSVQFDRFMETVHPDDRDRLRSAIEQHTKTGDRLQEEFRLVTPNGEVIYWSDRGKVIRDETERPYRWIGAGTNITERKKTLQALAESEERFRLITETITEAFWMADARLMRMLYVSPAYEGVWGRTRESLYTAPESFLQAVHPDDRSQVCDYLCFQLPHREVLNHEFRIMHADGTVKWIWNRGFPVLDEGGGGDLYVGVAIDITERKNLERQLSQAQKLESIGRLAAGIAHEINTPIQYVGDNGRFLEEAFSELIKSFDSWTSSTADQSTELGYFREEIPRAIQQLLEGVEQVARIVRAMKEFSHPGLAEKTATDINRAIESTGLISRNEWKYVSDLSTDLDPTLPPVPCLAGELNQVLLNLIVNAAQAIAAAKKDVAEKGSIHIQTRAREDCAEIRISDTGGGIPEAIRSKIFDPFFTTKPVGKGTGQGLAIAYSVIVQKHNGRISFETEVGRGTTFIIQLPFTS